MVTRFQHIICCIYNYGVINLKSSILIIGGYCDGSDSSFIAKYTIDEWNKLETFNTHELVIERLLMVIEIMSSMDMEHRKNLVTHCTHVLIYNFSQTEIIVSSHLFQIGVNQYLVRLIMVLYL